jgi:Uma2 family endonuclease
MQAEIPASYRLTWRDWVREAPEQGLCELIGGELHVSPAPTPEHQRLVGRLHAALFSFLDVTERGEVFQAPTGLRLTVEDVVEPDLFVVLAGGKARVTASAIVGVPALVIEVLSPGTARRDLVWKRELYWTAGVPEYWIVDPSARTVTMLTRGRGKWKSQRAAEVLFAAELPGFELPLKSLFR